MGGFTVYRINYPGASREEVLFHANLSTRNVMLECMLKAHTAGFRAGAVSRCPDCATSVVQRQPLLRAAEDTLQWLTRLPASVQAFSDLIAMISGDSNYERRWMGGYNDRQVAEAKFSQLVQTMSDCEDEFLYFQDDNMVCQHENWYRPVHSSGLASIINEQGPTNADRHRGCDLRAEAPSMTILTERVPLTLRGGFAIHRISHVETLLTANLAIRNLMVECMQKAETAGFDSGMVSRCPNRALSLIHI